MGEADGAGVSPGIKRLDSSCLGVSGSLDEPVEMQIQVVDSLQVPLML